MVMTVRASIRGEFEPNNQAAGQADFQAMLQIAQSFVLLAYFAVAEGLWGRGLGKWAMGLRVVNMQGETPGILRCVLRCYFIPAGFGLSVAAPLILGALFPNPEDAQTDDSAESNHEQ